MFNFPVRLCVICDVRWHPVFWPSTCMIARICLYISLCSSFDAIHDWKFRCMRMLFVNKCTFVFVEHIQMHIYKWQLPTYRTNSWLRYSSNNTRIPMTMPNLSEIFSLRAHDIKMASCWSRCEWRCIDFNMTTFRGHKPTSDDMSEILLDNLMRSPSAFFTWTGLYVDRPSRLTNSHSSYKNNPQDLAEGCQHTGSCKYIMQSTCRMIKDIV